MQTRQSLKATLSLAKLTHQAHNSTESAADLAKAQKALDDFLAAESAGVGATTPDTPPVQKSKAPDAKKSEAKAVKSTQDTPGKTPSKDDTALVDAAQAAAQSAQGSADQADNAADRSDSSAQDSQDSAEQAEEASQIAVNAAEEAKAAAEVAKKN